MTEIEFDMDIHPEREAERIVEFLQLQVRKKFRRTGGVIGVSGGVDSSVVLALAVRAFGPETTTAVIMPERESEPSSEDLAKEVARHFGAEIIVEDITLALEAVGCYLRRDAAIKRLFPGYEEEAGYKARIGIQGDLLEEGTLNIFTLTVVDPDGHEERKRMPIREFREIVAASNFKQRLRMTNLYYHAERKHAVVIGTSNKDEYELGFFVKYGDGGVDLHPIAHLYKTQIYQMAEYLDVPREIRERIPVTDTYGAGGSQTDFFFRVPFELLDVIWFGFERGVPAERLADSLDISVQAVQNVIDDIIRKKRTTEYLRLSPAGLRD